MTGDRRLNESELLALRLERIEGKRSINALNIIKNTNEEPTLFEIAIIEISSILDSQRDWIIKLSKRIMILEDKLKEV